MAGVAFVDVDGQLDSIWIHCSIKITFDCFILHTYIYIIYIHKNGHFNLCKVPEAVLMCLLFRFTLINRKKPAKTLCWLKCTLSCIWYLYRAIHHGRLTTNTLNKSWMETKQKCRLKTLGCQYLCHTYSDFTLFWSEVKVNMERCFAEVWFLTDIYLGFSSKPIMTNYPVHK